MKGSITQWGNSAALRIPKHILMEISAKVGDEIEMSVEHGRLTIAPPAQPSLSDLLSKVTPENKHVEMLNDSMGDELL